MYTVHLLYIQIGKTLKTCPKGVRIGGQLAVLGAAIIAIVIAFSNKKLCSMKFIQ